MSKAVIILTIWKSRGTSGVFLILECYLLVFNVWYNLSSDAHLPYSLNVLKQDIN